MTALAFTRTGRCGFAARRDREISLLLSSLYRRSRHRVRPGLGLPGKGNRAGGQARAVDAGYTGLVTGLAALCQGRRPARRRTGEQRLRLRQGSRSITDSALEGREPERLSGSWISRGRRRLIGGRGRVLESRAGAGTSARLRTGIVWANSLAKQARCPNPARWSSAADDGIAGSSACRSASASRRPSEEPKVEAISVARCDKTSSSSSSVSSTTSRSSLALHAISNLFASGSTSPCFSITSPGRSDGIFLGRLGAQRRKRKIRRGRVIARTELMDKA